MPTGKIEPEAKPAVWVVVDPEQLSVPTGPVHVAVPVQVPVVFVTVMFAGQLIAGAVLSTLFTLKLQLAVKPPLACVTVKVTDCTPTPDTKVPGAGTCTTVAPGQLSLMAASDL
jgi:hypothetical protein